MTFDGYLARRKELASLLQSESDSLSDAALIAAGYRAFGTGIFGRLFGEWNVAIYDSKLALLFLSADFSGARPLYYAQSKAAVRWSSSPSEMGSTCRTNVNLKYLTGFLVGLPELGETPWRSVKAVVPGTYLAISSDGDVRCFQVWAPAVTERINYRSDGEYEEHFRHVLWEVVEDRLSASTAVWVELSGGLDSSSLSCVVDTICRKRGTVHAATTVFYDFGRRDHRGDSDMVRSVMARLAIEGVVLKAPTTSLLSELWACPSTPACIGSLVPTLASMMKAAGCRTLVSGEGGDALMCDGSGWPCLPVIEGVYEGRWRSVVGDLVSFARATNRTIWQVFKEDVVRASQWRTPQVPSAAGAPWLSSGLVADYWAWAMAARAYPDFSSCCPSQALVYDFVEAARRSVAAAPDRLTEAIDLSYPYLDRRLVAFMFAVPFRQKMRAGQGRSLQRRALVGVLPDELRMGKKRISGSNVLLTALREEWIHLRGLLASDCALADLGLVDCRSLQAAATRARDGVCEDVGGLCRALAVERWLRTLTA